MKMKDNLKFKLKVNKGSNPPTPNGNNQNGVSNIKSCPLNNKKIYFNYIFNKEKIINPNRKPIHFNNNLLKEQTKDEIQENQKDIKNKQKTIENEYEKRNLIPKSEGKAIKLKPIYKNNLKQEIKKNSNRNVPSPFKEKESEIRPNSNNILPFVLKEKNKKILKSRSKNKNMHHNKSNHNIKINIDCALKSKNEENKEERLPNNILVKNIIKEYNTNSKSENNLVKIKNTQTKKSKKLKEFFSKEEPNLNNNKSMEDFTLIKNDFLKVKENNLSLFALFDGHGGAHVSQYLKNNFCDVLTKLIMEKTNLSLTEILSMAIQRIDKDLGKLNNVNECGSTGTIVLIDNNNDIIYCANIGDSKCFYIDDKEAIQMTEDHNCKNKIEVEAIKKRGAKVFNGRVFGALSLTRAFGDIDFKEFGLICEPYIKKISTENCKYIVIASDGIWDIIDDKKLFQIKNELKIGNCEELCNNLIEFSLRGGSFDNISCIVLRFGE